jgi:type IV pilus assembly protein PilC
MRFSYSAKKTDGTIYTSTFEGENRSALFAEVRRTGDVLISHKEVAASSFASLNEKFTSMFSRVKMMDKITFARSLANMLEAGLSLTRAITVMDKQTKNQKLKNIYQTLNSDLSAGKTFHDALQKFDKVFPSIFISMVKAGEESGNLAESLKTIAMQMEKTYQLQKKIKGAMVYPGVIISVMLLIGIIMMIAVVPKLTATFKDVKADLPGSTKLVIWLSDSLKNHYVLFACAVAALAGLLYMMMHTAKGRRGFDWFVTRIPVIGKIIIESNAARTTRTLSSLVGSGVDLLQAVRITKEVLQNGYYKEVMDEVEACVEKGKPLATVFTSHEHLYPPFVGEMISVGEETGRLASMLQGVATFYENEVEQKTKDLSTIVEPVLMVLVGAAVGFFAVAMISPMYSVMNNI